MAKILVSYIAEDKGWADWIRLELEKLGHTARLYDWEAAARNEAMSAIDRNDQADHALCVVSSRYIEKSKRHLQWERVGDLLAGDGRRNYVLPVLVEPTELPTSLAQFKRCDLYGLTEKKARTRIANYVKSIKPTVSVSSPVRSITFPGARLEPTVTNIPIQLQKLVPGNEAVLAEIRTALRNDGRAAIAGVAGTGKSTLAAVYARLHRSDYHVTWRIRADSASTMRADLLDLGVRQDWILAKEKDERALAAVLKRLEGDRGDILLIYDDAIDQPTLLKFLPSPGSAHIIVTTTNLDWQDLGVPVQIPSTKPRTAFKPADFFLSYSAADDGIAREVVAILERSGYSVIAQFKDFPVGSNYVEEMKKALRSATRVVALLSQAYEASSHCRAEWNAAYASDPDGSKRKLVPLLVEATDLNFLARQVVYANLIGLSAGEREQRIIEAIRGSTAAAAPVENITSPVRHDWTKDAKLTVQHSALPRTGIGRGQHDLLKQLATAKKLAQRLFDQSASSQFNYSKQYSIQFRAYLDDLPTSENEGNIYLADAAARTLREMFAAEADILSVGFTAPLKTFLECHVGMRAYYPELSEFYASVRDGVLLAPLALDAVERVREVIDEYTPDQFDPSVSRELAKEEASAPAIASEHEALVPNLSIPQPPPDPIAAVDRAQSRDQLIARSLNGLWSTFLRGKDIVPNIEGWRRAYESLEPAIRPVLHYLRESLGG